jgi:hypothetical protein
MGPRSRTVFEAIAARVVPVSATLAPGDRDVMFALVDQTLASRPAATIRQLELFLTLLRWAPLLRYGRRFETLAPARQDAVLRAAQDAPLQLLRSGFWGVRTLAYLGYYGRPDVYPSIGYTPTTDGLAVLHARHRR